MIRRKAFRGLLAVTALIIHARSTSADAVKFTGNAEYDFGVMPNSYGVAGINSDIGRLPGTGPSGFNFRDLNLNYDKSTDTLSVGIHFAGIAGDGLGLNGAPVPANLTAMGVYDTPNLGGTKSISVAFAPLGSPAAPIAAIVAGVPENKSMSGPGIDGFSVAKYVMPDPSNPSLANIEGGYGANLASNQGVLAFNPSAAHPDFEFTIKNFSKISGFDPTKGFYMTAYAGSGKDIAVGEDAIPWSKIPGSVVLQQQTIPEPATVLAWGLTIAGGVAFRALRRRRASA